MARLVCSKQRDVEGTPSPFRFTFKKEVKPKMGCLEPKECRKASKQKSFIGISRITDGAFLEKKVALQVSLLTDDNGAQTVGAFFALFYYH